MGRLSDDIKKEISEVAVEAVSELMDDSKIDSDEAIDLLAATLDALIPLNKIIPGPLGELAEQADDELFREIAKVLIKSFSVNPDKIEARARRAEENGNLKLAKRRTRRAARVRKRQLAKQENEMDGATND